MVSSGYETIIGLEIHVQLKTRSKMFCGCRVEFGAPPNSRVCPVCLGLPGALPVVNRRAVELAVRAALALGCDVHRWSLFARKNYFYPDLPKGYQISQYDRPLATSGSLEIEGHDELQGDRIRIRRLHLEEDSGKSTHDRFPGQTAIDLNRAGVPLIEIVTEPDLRSPTQARALLGRLKQTLEYLEVSDCNMEEGSLRVDANVSVRPAGARRLMTKTEVKNMNSFSQLEKALAFEAARHASVLEAGGRVEHQTMLWDPSRGETRPMRGKEEIHDYRYFPDPDLEALEVSEEMATTLSALPEPPWEKERRFVEQYGLPGYDARVLSATRALADLYEAVAQASSDPKEASNWVMGEVLALSNELAVPVERLQVDPQALGDLIALVGEGTLSRQLAKRVFRRMIDTGKTARQVMVEEDLQLVGGGDRLAAWVEEALAGNPAEVERFRQGEEKLLAFFIGQVMRKSEGRADPGRTRQLLLDRLRQG